MRNYPALLLCLLLLTCHAANSQTVRLLPAGTVLRHTWVGMDTATYATFRQARVDLAAATGAFALDSLQIAGLAAELRRCRGQQAAGSEEFNRLSTYAEKQAQVPPRPPLLLDGRLYKGLIVGAVLGEVVRIFFFRSL